MNILIICEDIQDGCNFFNKKYWQQRGSTDCYFAFDEATLFNFDHKVADVIEITGNADADLHEKAVVMYSGQSVLDREPKAVSDITYTPEEWEEFRLTHASPLGGPNREDYPRLMNEVREGMKKRAERKDLIEYEYDELDLVPNPGEHQQSKLKEFFNNWI